MIIIEELTCEECKSTFKGFGPFCSYTCNRCGKPITLCPDCASKTNKCSWCGGVYIHRDNKGLIY